MQCIVWFVLILLGDLNIKCTCLNGVHYLFPGPPLLAHPGGDCLPASLSPISPLPPLCPQRGLLRDQASWEDRHCGKDRIWEVEPLPRPFPHRGTGGGTGPYWRDQCLPCTSGGPAVRSNLRADYLGYFTILRLTRNSFIYLKVLRYLIPYNFIYLFTYTYLFTFILKH